MLSVNACYHTTTVTTTQPTTTTTTPGTTTSPCTNGFYECAVSKLCVPPSSRCNGICDCAEECDDETDCGQFTVNVD